MKNIYSEKLVTTTSEKKLIKYWLENRLIIIKDIKLNYKNILNNLSKILKKKKIHFIIVDNIRVGIKVNITKRNLYYINPFAYFFRYFNCNDLIKLGVFKKKNPFPYKSKYKKKYLKEINVTSNLKVKKKIINNILILGPEKRNIKIATHLLKKDFKVKIYNNNVNFNFLKKNKVDFIISNGFPYKINKKITEFYKFRIINLHATYLPWGKGIGTNLFSFLLEQPTGVSIHYINSDFDRGNVICRSILTPKNTDTNRTFYVKLLNKLDRIFIKNYKKIILFNPKNYNQKKFFYIPPYYSRNEFEKIISTLPLGYDTKIKDLINLGLIFKNNEKLLIKLNEKKR